MGYRRHQRLTHEDIDLLRHLAENGLRVTAIARRLGRTVGSLRTKAFKEGISLVEATADPFG